MELRVHDLARLAPGAIAAMRDAPDWAKAALARAPWAVVRRAAPIGSLIPVGLRGDSRAERFATTAPCGAIAERLAPEQLARRAPPRRHRAFDALAALTPTLDASGLPWGPVGAAGFEIATGRATLTDASDLDLILRAPDLGAIERLHGVAEAAREAAMRIDILVETPLGAAALAELAGGGDEILLRSAFGPRLARRDAFATPVRC